MAIICYGTLWWENCGGEADGKQCQTSDVGTHTMGGGEGANTYGTHQPGRHTNSWV